MPQFIDFRHKVVKTDTTKKEVHEKYSLWNGKVTPTLECRVLTRYECVKCHLGVWYSLQECPHVSWDLWYAKSEADAVRKTLTYDLSDKCAVGEVKTVP
jgi:hypothetical protein